LCCNLILKREPKDLDDHRFGQVVFITQHTHYAQQEKTAGRRFKGRASGRQAPKKMTAGERHFAAFCQPPGQPRFPAYRLAT
jgi:hypothetical protein